MYNSKKELIKLAKESGYFYYEYYNKPKDAPNR